MEKLARRWKRLTAKEVRDKAYKNKIKEQYPKTVWDESYEKV